MLKSCQGCLHPRLHLVLGEPRRDRDAHDAERLSESADFAPQFWPVPNGTAAAWWMGGRTNLPFLPPWPGIVEEAPNASAFSVFSELRPPQSTNTVPRVPSTNAGASSEDLRLDRLGNLRVGWLGGLRVRVVNGDVRIVEAFVLTDPQTAS